MNFEQYCSICNQETVHSDYTQHILSNIIVCRICGTLKDKIISRI